VAADIPSDDASLVRTLQTGTPQEVEKAFSELYLRHSSRLFRHLQKKGLASEEQDDVAQETWLRAFQKIGQFEDRGVDLYPWLRTIADNVALEHFRSRLNQMRGGQLGETSDISEDARGRSIPHDSPSALEIL
jgi:DNA-directed RNA polymerase specialized sigma24 family protein